MDPAVKAMFKGKLRDEGNRVCADCAERNPTWASVRYVHRQSSICLPACLQQKRARSVRVICG